MIGDQAIYDGYVKKRDTQFLAMAAVEHMRVP